MEHIYNAQCRTTIVHYRVYGGEVHKDVNWVIHKQSKDKLHRCGYNVKP